MANTSVSEYWNKKTFIIVTGASRGIGRTLSEKLADLIFSGSVLLLISRDEKSLKSLSISITSQRPEIHVPVGVVDLSSCDESVLNTIITTALADLSLKPDSFSHSICIHNAASLGGATKRCTDFLELDPCQDYFRLNLTSMMVLNSIFMRLFVDVRKTVVNITSLCGIEPFPSLALYCIGKAAREMFFKVLAKEEPSTRVLNYSPGPVQTSMRSELLNETWNEEAKKGEDLTTEMTCARFIQILTEDKYASGAHVDYYDA